MKRIHYIVILAILLFSCEKAITPYQAQNFIKYFGSGYESKGNDVIQLSDGNYAFTGYDVTSSGDYQIFAAKVDKNGNQIWSNTWGVSDREEGNVIKEVSDGLLIAGTALKSNGVTHSFLMKIDLNGEHEPIWYQKYGIGDTSIFVNDILLAQNNIYLVGKIHIDNETISRSYIKKLDYNGSGNSENIPLESVGSVFNKGFNQADTVSFIGTLSNRVLLSTFKDNIINPLETIDNITLIDNQTVDAIYSNNSLFILVNEKVQSTLNLKVLKLNSSFDEIWHSESIPTTEGKAFTLRDDGSLLVCGEQIGAESRIYFALVDQTGVISNGDGYFRTLPGYVGKIIETQDKGVIMVGTTGSTYGTMVQLIKTDKDLFLLKP